MSKSFQLKTKAYEKTQGICIICAQPIDKQPAQWSMEHYIPRAIYKWLPNPELETRLESLENLFVVHAQCNLVKDSRLPSLAQIRALPVAEQVRDEVQSLYQWAKPNLEQYVAMKQSTWDSQRRRCAFCQRAITLPRATLRRKDNSLPRSRSNAMCLCLSCSVKAGNPRYKQHMVQRLNIIAK